MRKSILVLAVCALVILAGAQAFAAITTLVDIPMNQQINVGKGDAIFSYNNTPPNFLDFQPAAPPDDPTGFVREHIMQAKTWFYGPYIDFVRAGIGSIDISKPNRLYRIEFDMRYYNDSTNTNPYSDTGVFIRLYQMDGSGVVPGTVVGYRDFNNLVYNTNQGDKRYPEWTHKVFVLNDTNRFKYSDITFNPAQVNRLRFFGTDWTGAGSDYLDVKNVKITEEIVGTASGVVKDTNGDPVANATVGIKLAPNAAADAMAYLTTDAQGKYSIMLSGDTYYFAAWKYGCLPSADAVLAVTGGPITVPDLILEKAGNNLAIAPGVTVSATNEDPGNPAAKAVDDNMGSRWITGNPLPNDQQDQSYIINLGGSKEVTGVAINMENARPSDYTIDVTTDPNPSLTSAWTTVYSATGSQGGIQFNGHFQPVRFSPHKNITGIRYHVTKFGPYPVYSVWEFFVYGTGPGTYYEKIKDVKALADGATVEIIKPVIFSDMWDGSRSAVFSNRLWMEEADRSAGIRIDMVDHWCYAGELDYIKGTVQTDAATGERYIAGAAAAYPGASNITFAPFAMNNKDLDSKAAWGKMVKTWGKITEKMTTTDPISGEEIPAGFKISDGSGNPVTVIAEGNQMQVGTFTTVTGMLSGNRTIYAGRQGDGTIRTWLMHGGYSVDQPADDDENHAAWQKANLDQDFLGGEATIQPKPGDIGPNGDKWFVKRLALPDFASYKSDNTANTSWTWNIDLGSVPFKPSGKGETCAYASIWVYADHEYNGYYDNLTFKIGSDDGMKIWLNGKAIYTVNLWRGCTRDNDTITNTDPMTGGDLYVLKPGWNHILVKSNNITGGWGFTFRMTYLDGDTPLNLPTSVVPWGAAAF